MDVSKNRNLAFSVTCASPRPRCGPKLSRTPPKSKMRFDTQQLRFYRGVELHARTISERGDVALVDLCFPFSRLFLWERGQGVRTCAALQRERYAKSCPDAEVIRCALNRPNTVPMDQQISVPVRGAAIDRPRPYLGSASRVYGLLSSPATTRRRARPTSRRRTGIAPAPGPDP